jgi:hypothetical protein
MQLIDQVLFGSTCCNPVTSIPTARFLGVSFYPGTSAGAYNPGLLLIKHHYGNLYLSYEFEGNFF